MKQIVEDRGLVAMAYDFDGFLKDARLTSARLNVVSRNGEPYSENLYLDDWRQELWEAVQKDFAEGNIGVRYLFDNSEERLRNTCYTDLIFEVTENRSEARSPADNPNEYYETVSSGNAIRITLTPQAKHTLAVLDSTGIWEEGYSLRYWTLDDDSREYPDTMTEGRSEIVY